MKLSDMQPIETAPKDGTHILVVTDKGDFGIAGWLRRFESDPYYWMYCADGDYCVEAYGQCPMAIDDKDRNGKVIGWWPLPQQRDSA